MPTDSEIDTFSVSRLQEVITSAGFSHNGIYDKLQLRRIAKQATSSIRDGGSASFGSGHDDATLPPPPSFPDPYPPGYPDSPLEAFPEIYHEPNPEDPYYVPGAPKTYLEASITPNAPLTYYPVDDPNAYFPVADPNVDPSNADPYHEDPYNADPYAGGGYPADPYSGYGGTSGYGAYPAEFGAEEDAIQYSVGGFHRVPQSVIDARRKIHSKENFLVQLAPSEQTFEQLMNVEHEGYRPADNGGQCQGHDRMATAYHLSGYYSDALLIDAPTPEVIRLRISTESSRLRSDPHQTPFPPVVL